ncbi:PucR family transcriptional regulator [Mycolicibacterium sp. 050158]|uniref:PucR family transcriptional regulator n=1 Tax=Mycolicibacterium sp. 050158 TaxID=3090602 RepID=UPI00299E055F|nr:PucR family transcriptional regulator [Mycolicibacterium sp. 050158]MDX1890555.1 PucR family transcriptional regulator [Mycolicibacterium sp. 050158]
MITVGDVLAAPSLGLQLIVGGDGLDRLVRSAHVSELTAPGDWLRGGELLMTVGLLLPMRPSKCRAYLAECAAAGVAGVALGLGHGLPYQSCPEPLRDAAEEVGVPLLVVPDETPFIAVTKWVFETIAGQERRDLQTAMEINRRLTGVATSAAPLQALLAAWSESSATPCVVCDGGGRLMAATAGADAELVERACRIPFHPRVAGGGWSMVEDFEVHTVGAEVPLAYVVLGADMDVTSRSSSTVLVSLIALDIERRNLSDQPERRRRGQVFAQLLRPDVKPERARHLAASVGLTGEHYQVAVAATSDPEALAFRMHLGLDGALVRVHGATVEIAHSDPTALTNILAVHATGLPVGIGAATSPESLAVSAMQARSLLPISEQLGRIVTASEGETVSLLLSLGAPEVVRGFADAVLAPLDRLDPRDRLELLRTLDQWLRANGAWDPAAHRLSLHRNTVRNRIERIAALTGRRLDDGDDRMELWLALKARAALPQ